MPAPPHVTRQGLESGKEIAVLNGHTGWVVSARPLHFSDNQRSVTGLTHL